MRLKIVLTENQWKRISDISSAVGLILIGSVVIPSLVDKVELKNIILGLLGAFISWFTSLYTAKKY